MGWGGANNVALRLHTHFDTTCLKFTCPCIVSSCYACLRNSVSPCFCIPFFANKCQETERVNKAGTVIVRMLRRKKKKTSLHDITRTTFQPYPRCGPGRNRRISKRGAGGLKTRSHQPQQKEKLQSKRRAQVASLPFVICQADIRKMSLRIYPC